MREGTLLNKRYRLLALLGEGGMAAVYRAEDTVLGRPVAVKVLRASLAKDQAFLARFRDEARSAAALSHPNLVATYDVGQDAGYYYIVMEYVDGPSLKEAIAKEAPLPVDRAVGLALQVLAALEAAHARGVIHRDIKPQNVLLTAEGQAKVADFGIARQVAAVAQTQGGEIMGTAAYLAPERASGNEASAASDVYSVGVLLFEMLTGRTPFTGDNPVEVALKHVREEPPSPRRFNPAVPPLLEAVVLRALAKDPTQRYRSAKEMARALLEYQSGAAAVTAPIRLGGGATAAALPGQTRAAHRPAPAARPARGFNWIVAVLLLATAVLLALLVPLGQLFYASFLRPMLAPTPAITAAPAPQPTDTPTITVTATATLTPSPTATQLPTATPTPPFPAWMRFILADRNEIPISTGSAALSEIKGQIVDSRGRLVPGQRLRIEASGGWKEYRPRPGIDVADGTFRFDQLSPGRYSVTIVDQNDQPISETAADLVTDNVPPGFKGYVSWNITFRQLP